MGAYSGHLRQLEVALLRMESGGQESHRAFCGLKNLYSEALQLSQALDVKFQNLGARHCTHYFPVLKGAESGQTHYFLLAS